MQAGFLSKAINAIRGTPDIPCSSFRRSTTEKMYLNTIRKICALTNVTAQKEFAYRKTFVSRGAKKEGKATKPETGITVHASAQMPCRGVGKSHTPVASPSPRDDPALRDKRLDCVKEKLGAVTGSSRRWRSVKKTGLAGK